MADGQWTVTLCSSCRAEILWATLGASRMPLDHAQAGDGDVAPGMVAYNPRTGNGRVLKLGDLDQVPAWRARGVTVHQSHFATCPQAAQHRRRRDG